MAEKWRTQSARKSPAPYPANLATEAAFLASLPTPTILPRDVSDQGDAQPAVPPAEKRSVATQLVDLAGTRWRFAISTEGDAFALPLVGPTVVRMLTGSRSIRAELADVFQETTAKVAGQQALADAVLVLEGRARRNEPVPLALRVAYVDGAAWLDLDTLTGEAVKVTAAGWELVASPPILFRRTALSGVLPGPVAGGDLGELWALLNVVPESRPVLLAWLVAALLPDLPHPVAALVGEQGTGKSTASRMLAALLDPSPAQLRKPPRDVEGGLRPDEHEAAILREACRTADSLDVLQAQLELDGIMSESSQGSRVHPAMVEIRQQRIVFARLLTALRIPQGEADGRAQSRGGARGVYGITGTG